MAIGVWQSTIRQSGRAAVVSQLTVIDSGTLEPRVLWADSAATIALTNPFFTDQNGFARFYTEEGLVGIQIVAAGKSAQLSDIFIVGDLTPTPPVGPTTSWVVLSNYSAPKLSTWEAPALDNYRAVFFSPDETFYSISASRDGTLIALGTDTDPYIRVLHNDFTDIDPDLTLPDVCYALSVSRDGKFIIAACYGTSPYLFLIDVEGDYSISEPASPAPAFNNNLSYFNKLAWNSDASQLAYVGMQNPVGGKYIIIYDMPGFDVVSGGPSVHVDAPMYSCVYGGDDAWLAVCFDSGGVVIYSTVDWSVIAVVSGLDDVTPTTIAYSAGLGQLACGDEAGHVYIIDVDTWSVVNTDTSHEAASAVISISFSSDDAMLLVAYHFDPNLVIYDMPAFTENSFYPPNDGFFEFVYAGAFIPRIV